MHRDIWRKSRKTHFMGYARRERQEEVEILVNNYK
jgi:hypothetical protein